MIVIILKTVNGYIFMTSNIPTTNIPKIYIYTHIYRANSQQKSLQGTLGAKLEQCYPLQIKLVYYNYHPAVLQLKSIYNQVHAEGITRVPWTFTMIEFHLSTAVSS